MPAAHTLYAPNAPTCAYYSLMGENLTLPSLSLQEQVVPLDSVSVAAASSYSWAGEADAALS